MDLLKQFIERHGGAGASISDRIAGIAALNGARDVQLDDAERRSAWDTLAGELRELGVTPPELGNWSAELETRDGAIPRVYPLENVELREDGDDGPRMRGTAIVYGQRADIGPFIEEIAPGAAAKSIREAPIVFLWNHNSDFPLAKTGETADGRSRGLTVTDTPRGVEFEARPPNNPTVRDLFVEPVRRGIVDKMSFAFRSWHEREEWKIDKKSGKPLRVLKEIGVRDLSPVTFEAYSGTELQLRRRISDAETLGLPVDELVGAVCRRAAGGSVDGDDAIFERWIDELRRMKSGDPEPDPDPAAFDELERRRMKLKLQEQAAGLHL